MNDFKKTLFEFIQSKMVKFKWNLLHRKTSTSEASLNSLHWNLTPCPLFQICIAKMQPEGPQENC